MTTATVGVVTDQQMPELQPDDVTSQAVYDEWIRVIAEHEVEALIEHAPADTLDRRACHTFALRADGIDITDGALLQWYDPVRRYSHTPAGDLKWPVPTTDQLLESGPNLLEVAMQHTRERLVRDLTREMYSELTDRDDVDVPQPDCPD